MLYLLCIFFLTGYLFILNWIPLSSVLHKHHIAHSIYLPSFSWVSYFHLFPSCKKEGSKQIYEFVLKYGEWIAKKTLISIEPLVSLYVLQICVYDWLVTTSIQS